MLKTAEDTGASMITEATEARDQILSETHSLAEETTLRANQYAEKTIREADQYAEKTTKEANLIFQKAQKQAEDQAKIITSAAEAKAKETIKEIRESMQSLVRSYDGLLDQREALVKSLKRLSQDALNQIDLSDAHFFRIDGKAYQRAIDELSRSSHFSVANIAILATQVEAPVNAEPEEQFEEDMTNATLEEETMETVEALTHELEEQGEIPVEETVEDVMELEGEPIEEEEVPIVNEAIPVVEDEVMEEEEIEEEEATKVEISEQQKPTNKTEDTEPEDLKKSSGSFFDQFD